LRTGRLFQNGGSSPHPQTILFSYIHITRPEGKGLLVEPVDGEIHDAFLYLRGIKNVGKARPQELCSMP
jgi:hypothetical protein